MKSDVYIWSDLNAKQLYHIITTSHGIPPDLLIKHLSSRLQKEQYKSNITFLSNYF